MVARTRRRRAAVSRGRKGGQAGLREQASEATMEITCAFCGGKGRDPFGIMSPLATCQVCDGEGHVSMREPVAKCAFCGGTGVFPNLRQTCSVCGGVGSVEIPENAVTCPHCGGTGRTADCVDCPWDDSMFPCQHCKGAGYMSPSQS
jgi:DnaJ-class molecular chaperone